MMWRFVPVAAALLSLVVLSTDANDADAVGRMLDIRECLQDKLISVKSTGEAMTGCPSFVDEMVDCYKREAPSRANSPCRSGRS